MNSIEFGCRYNMASDQIADVVRLKDLYNFQHLQILSPDFQELKKALDITSSAIGNYDLELSYKTTSSDNDIFSFSESAFSILNDYGVKYFVLDAENNIITSRIALFDMVKNIALQAKKHRILTCVNIHSGNSFEAYLNAYNEVRESVDSEFLLLSVESDKLDQTRVLINHIEYLYKWCAIFQVNVDVQPSSFQNIVYPFVDRLFWLPWKERPLIFTNPISENYWIFQKLIEMIEQNNYYYP